MAEILEFDESKKDGFSYFEDSEGRIGVSSLCQRFIIIPDGFNRFAVYLDGNEVMMARSELARLLHGMLVFVDSQERFIQERELIGFNYE